MSADTCVGHWGTAKETTIEIHFFVRFLCTEIREVSLYLVVSTGKIIPFRNDVIYLSGGIPSLLFGPQVTFIDVCPTTQRAICVAV